MKIEYYPGYCVVQDFVDIENQNIVLINNDLNEDNCVLQCSSHSSDQSMGQKTECSSTSFNGDAKSKSFPDGFKHPQNEQVNSYDEYRNVSCLCVTPYLSNDSWYKTWPEKCDKTRSNMMNICNICANCESKNTHFNNLIIEKNKSVNRALDDISLSNNDASTNLTNTSQSNLTNSSVSDDNTNKDLNQNEQVSSEVNVNESEQLNLKIRSDPFSKIVPVSSELSSSNHSQSNGRPCSSYTVNSGCSSKRKLSNFLNRNVLLGWKPSDVPSSIGNFLKLFGSNNQSISSYSNQDVASSSALFQYSRPPNVPAKSLEEEQKHREEYEAILAAAKRKEAMHSATKKKLERKQLEQEEGMANAAKYFVQKVLTNWESMRDNKKTRELWWQGLPSNVRGKVWSFAIGNELNLTQQLYEICLARAQEKLNTPNNKYIESISSQERSLDAIKLDISRTFPHLCIFQEGGPYSEILHSLLAAYVCYRPDVGYVQGMSYIAAILILNMEQKSAFICFANLLNQPLHLSAFTLNQNQMLAYFEAFHEVFNHNLPKLFSHFRRSGLTPDLYLLDWIYTIFAKAMPLDVACRIWDVFLRDGYEFIFGTALGILHLYQDTLMKMDFLDGAQFLTRLPDNICSDHLFRSIQNISVNIGKITFSQIVEKQILLSEHRNDS